MDTSNPAIFVNGESLQMYVGKKVRAVVQIIKSDGADMIGKSTDEHQWTLKGLSSAPLMSYVEVIGVAESNQSIGVELWTDFGNSFGTKCPLVQSTMPTCKWGIQRFISIGDGSLQSFD
ncbi:hypothetical protein MANES_10G061800v8 [Manihot esculenta]|uniref:Uncharacterized protein n=4 Tax=Manihot esculenta TaxID=3983 RepID=A0A251JZ60_MANES|nr:hypothetical protein MANES_10G061800v8 [Manihot esculenta]KAG8645393.1 hypothetical protein MANES_10G061800v8 [Manihot esculenta]KAG8645395.1 hypothetical protein MANES_10G061800v8 [Manihot esculenta]OAY39026.1 hypothetical protein MANES_10G061800v8 [Manihot esculenta]OAY39028.1 hypothetical protein MANES_10G061800v8 [Manihot esculenta]